MGTSRQTKFCKWDTDAWRWKRQGYLIVILEMLSDVRVIEFAFDTDSLKFSAGADSRQHQDVRRPHCACAEDNFLRCRNGLKIPICIAIFDRSRGQPRAAFVSDNSGDVGAGYDAEVLTVFRSAFQIAVIRARTATIT